MTKKKPEPNPIEDAIGERARSLKAQAKATKEALAERTPLNDSPQTPHEPDEPTPTEMLNLEELNRQTEERLRDESMEGEPMTRIVTPKSPIPASKPDPPPETETCSPESPPQKVEEIDEYQDARKFDEHQKHVEAFNKTAKGLGIAPTVANIKEKPSAMPEFSAEDIELTALKKYIFEDGFVVATVAFHIVSLCAQPMVTPSTTTWDFVDRANIPDMVFALLNQPGYLEGIWPSLKIIMGTNKGNAAWCSGIATTMAFFDIIRTLPTLKDMNREDEKKS